MVIELQKNAALKTRKTVIRRTLAGRSSFKDLQDCLRLHLPAPFLTVTLLTRGYFEILFEKEEGARATRKLAVVEWSGWALSFSRYSRYSDQMNTEPKYSSRTPSKCNSRISTSSSA
jgi:hypothetical protein